MHAHMHALPLPPYPPTPIPYPQPHPLPPHLGEVNNRVQCRETAKLARERRGNSGTFDRLHGLQYAIDHCEPLRVLVEEVCSHLGGPVLVPVLVCVCVCVCLLVPVPVPMPVPCACACSSACACACMS